MFKSGSGSRSNTSKNRISSPGSKFLGIFHSYIWHDDSSTDHIHWQGRNSSKRFFPFLFHYFIVSAEVLRQNLLPKFHWPKQTGERFAYNNYSCDTCEMFLNYSLIISFGANFAAILCKELGIYQNVRTKVNYRLHTIKRRSSPAEAIQRWLAERPSCNPDHDTRSLVPNFPLLQRI